MEPGSGRRTRRSAINNGAPNLLVDIQTVQGGFFGNRGIRRYAIGFASALLSRHVVRALLMNPGRPWHEDFPPELQSASEVAWSTRRGLRDLGSDDAAVYVITSPFELTSPAESALPSFVTDSGMPIISVLYDLIPEVMDVYPPSLIRPYRARRGLLKQADLLLTLSEHVRGDAIARLQVDPKRVATVGAAASGFFRPRQPGERPRELLAERVPAVTRPFAVSVTGWLANKNAGGLIEAWARLPGRVRRDRQLVLTCPLPPGAAQIWSDMATGFGLAPDDVVVTGQVDDHVVRALYQEAELFVLPSYEEGFGLPVLEAARCGCPAITSSSSSLPEILQWKPSAFPPDDVDTMAAVIERGLLDAGYRADLRAVGDAAAAQHTWDRVAARTVDACETMLTPLRSRRVAPLRVAFVGRFSGTAPRVTQAVDQAVASLDGTCRVDYFDVTASSRATRGKVVRDTSSRDARRHPAHALGQVLDPWDFDALVYVFDRHPDQELADLARDHPGLVWFVETPDDPVAAELTRRATAILRSPDVAAPFLHAAAFGRSVPERVVSGEGFPFVTRQDA